jgi:type IV secretory pathway TrbD component
LVLPHSLLSGGQAVRLFLPVTLWLLVGAQVLILWVAVAVLADYLQVRPLLTQHCHIQ